LTLAILGDFNLEDVLFYPNVEDRGRLIEWLGTFLIYVPFLILTLFFIAKRAVVD